MMGLLLGHLALSYLLTWSARVFGYNVSRSVSDYIKMRQDLLQQDMSTVIGHKIKLTPDEIEVNDALSVMKDAEYSKSSAVTFPGSSHFFHYNKYIQSTPLFDFFKHLPKGAVLHCHDVALVSLDFVTQELLHKPNLYMCWENKDKPEEQMMFRFLRAGTSSVLKCDWQLVEDVRKAMGQREFDTWVLRHLSLVVDNPEEMYPDETTVWARFEYVLGVLVGLITYVDVFPIYNRELLKQFYLDNVLYLEMRGFIPQLYDLDENVLPHEVTIQSYKSVSEEFVKQTNGEFLGMKYIATAFKSNTPEDVQTFLNLTAELQSKFPDFVIGFDLVGQETAGRPIVDFSAILLRGQAEHGMKYFLHAGETVQQGTAYDENLLDAVLLNSNRIGHAFALNRHPMVKNLVQKRQITIEVNPISNQVLNLVKDLRNHPAVQMIEEGLPLVISSDDFATWDATPLTHDFYITYLVLSGRRGDLRTIKQLAINSLQFSELNQEEKQRALKIWNRKWDSYMRDIVRRYSSANDINSYRDSIVDEKKEDMIRNTPMIKDDKIHKIP